MSARQRIQLGIVLMLVGVAGMILAFGPAKFADRLAGRVDAPGTVQWGVSRDAVSPDDRIDDGAYGLWKVDYEIDGAGHTGILIGQYREGQKVMVSAPSDGSIYAILHEAPPTAVKILSWLLVPAALAAIVVGIWQFSRGLRIRDALAKQEAREQLSRRYPHLFPPAPLLAGAAGDRPPEPAQPPAAEPQLPPSLEPQRPGNKPDFYAPYDL